MITRQKTVRVEFAPEAKGELIVLADAPDCFRQEGYDIAIAHEELGSVFYFCAIGMRNWTVQNAPLTTGSYAVEEGNEEQVYVLYALFPEQTFATEAEIGAFLDGALYVQRFQQQKEIQFHTKRLEALRQRRNG